MCIFCLSLLVLETILLAHLYNIMAYATLGEIARFFVNENKALVKGENAVESNHVVGVTQYLESGTLQGDIQASQRDKTYAVKVSFSHDLKDDLYNIYFCVWVSI